MNSGRPLFADITAVSRTTLPSVLLVGGKVQEAQNQGRLLFR